MSSTFPDSSAEHSPLSSSRWSAVKTRLGHAAREPLVHFLLFGALIFAVDALLASRAGDPNLITVGADVAVEAKALFRTSIGREPTPQEMKQLTDRWVDNEVLYREGLALGVDKGDKGIRDRVIFKALNIMQSNLTAPPADEKTLRDWFEKNRANYDEPPRYDFVEAVLIGDTSPESVKKFSASLNAGVQDDEKSGLRVFKGRPRSNLVISYGEAFTQALDQLHPGQWQALNGKDGVHVVRLEAKQAGVPTTYDAVRAQVFPDWKDATLQQLRTDAVRELGKKYRIAYAPAAS